MKLKHALVLILLALYSPALAQDSLGINLEGYDYPYPVKEFQFRSQQQDLTMAFQHEKSPNPNGKTVVLLHGKNFNGAYWGETVKALLDSGYNVVVPDQIGFGKSSKPAHYHFTFQQLAENTRALLKSEGVDEAIILGHSMGGMLATRYALMYPESTSKLILLNPIGLEDWKLKVPYVGVDDWYEQELKKTAEGIKKYQLESYYFGQWNEQYDPWVYLLAAPLESPDYPRLAWNAALTRFCPGIEAAAAGVQLFVCECSCFPRGCEPLYCREVHLSWEDVAEICEKAQPERVILTHLYEPVLAKKPNPLDSLQQRLSVPVRLAEDGLSVEI